MLVKAKAGTRCPMEGKPRQYITDIKAVEVKSTAYYRRLVADGSLEIVSSPQSPDKDNPPEVIPGPLPFDRKNKKGVKDNEYIV